MLRGKFKYARSRMVGIAILLFFVDLASLLLVFTAVNEQLIFKLGFASFLTAIVVVVGLSPLLTAHEVHDTYFVIRQGWYYRNVIDMTDVVSIKLVRQGPFALGVHFLGNSTIYVNGSTNDVIMLELRPMRNRSGKRRRMTRILFDVKDVEGFMKKLGREFDGVLQSIEH
jgi:hypothetical protein